MWFKILEDFVFDNTELTMPEKMLYMYITNFEVFFWSNKFLQKKWFWCRSSLKKRLKKLKDLWFIEIQLNYDLNNNERRKITPILHGGGGVKNYPGGGVKNYPGGGVKNYPGGGAKIYTLY